MNASPSDTKLLKRDCLAPSVTKDVLPKPIYDSEFYGKCPIDLKELEEDQIEAIFWGNGVFGYEGFPKKYLMPGIMGFYAAFRYLPNDFSQKYAMDQKLRSQFVGFIKNQLKNLPDTYHLKKKFLSILKNKNTAEQLKELTRYIEELIPWLLKAPEPVKEWDLIYYIMPAFFAYSGPKPENWDRNPEDLEHLPESEVDPLVWKYAMEIYETPGYPKTETIKWMGRFLYNYLQKGGTLSGLKSKIPYIRSLVKGPIAIYTTPIFHALGAHGYDAIDFFSIHPSLGSMNDYLELLSSAHENGMKLVLDLAVSHTSKLFFAYQDLESKGQESDYADWYKGAKFNAEGKLISTDCWFNNPRCPLLNFETNGVRNYFLGCWKSDESFENQDEEWKQLVLRLTGPQGKEEFSKLMKNEAELKKAKQLLGAIGFWTCTNLDGWRLDVPNDINSQRFWSDFGKMTRMIRPDIYIVGENKDETVSPGVPIDRRWFILNRCVHASMNYDLRKTIINFFVPSSYKELTEDLEPPLKGSAYAVSPGELASRLETYFSEYPSSSLKTMMNLFGGHDRIRLLSLTRGNQRLAGELITFMATMPGLFTIYGGDELGMEGVNEPDCRHSPEYDEQGMPVVKKPGFMKIYRSVLALRESHKESFSSANLQNLYAKGRIFAYLRWDGKEREKVICAFNRGDQEVTLDLFLAGPLLENETFFYDTKETYEVRGHKLRITLPAKSHLILTNSSTNAGPLKGLPQKVFASS